MCKYIKKVNADRGGEERIHNILRWTDCLAVTSGSIFPGLTLTCVSIVDFISVYLVADSRH